MVPGAGVEPARYLIRGRFSYHYSFYYQHYAIGIRPFSCLWSGLCLDHETYQMLKSQANSTKQVDSFVIHL